jgi:hypothetical protein
MRMLCRTVGDDGRTEKIERVRPFVSPRAWHGRRISIGIVKIVDAFLTVVSTTSVAALAYVAFAMIRLANRRSVMISLTIAITMALGFVTLVTGARVVIASHPP